MGRWGGRDSPYSKDGGPGSGPKSGGGKENEAHAEFQHLRRSGAASPYGKREKPTKEKPVPSEYPVNRSAGWWKE